MRPLCVSTDIIILGALQLPLRVDTEEHLQRLDQGHGSLCLLPETYYWVYVSSKLSIYIQIWCTNQCRSPRLWYISGSRPDTSWGTVVIKVFSPKVLLLVVYMSTGS